MSAAFSGSAAVYGVVSALALAFFGDLALAFFFLAGALAFFLAGALALAPPFAAISSAAVQR